MRLPYQREWTWITTQLRRIPVLWRRVLTVVLGVVGVLVGAAAPALASSETPPALNWIKLLDSTGISVWAYEMSLNTGGVTHPGKFVWSFLVDLVWQGYRGVVVLAIWLINWVLGFSWLDWIAAPVIELSKTVTDLVNRFGLTPTFLTILAAIASVHIFRGRWTLGAFELVAGCAIAALAVGGLSDPVGLVTGQDGYIMQSRDLGLEISSGLANHGDTTANADQLRAETSSMLVDTFIRMPHEMINYGRSLQGDPCEAKYDEVMRSGPHNGDDTVRNAMKDCNGSMGDYADNPNSGMAISAVILGPSAIFVLLFAIVLCGAVMAAAASVLYESLKLIVTMIWGILPGDSRGSLWNTVGHLVMSLAIMTFSVVFLTAYLLVLQSVFHQSNSGSNGVMATFLFVDILIVLGIVLFWRGRTALKRSAARLAGMLAKRPAAGAPSRLPTPQHSGLPGKAAALQAGRMWAQRGMPARTGTSDTATGAGRGGGKDWASTGTPGATTTGRFTRVVGTPRAAGATPAAAAVAAAAGPVPPRSRRNGGTPEEGAARRPGRGVSPEAGAAEAAVPATSPAVDLTKRLAATQGRKALKGTLVRMAAHTAAGVATGGASTAVSAASAARTAQALNNVRRTAVAARLARAAVTTGSTPANGAPGGPAGPRPAGQGPGATARVLPPPSAHGYEQVEKGGQTILVPHRDKSPVGAGAPAGSPGRPRPTGGGQTSTSAAQAGTSSRPSSASTHPAATDAAPSGGHTETAPRAAAASSTTAQSSQQLRAQLAARRAARPALPPSRLPSSSR